jgi:hypothetical protein
MQTYLINAIHETEREINRLRDQIAGFETVLKDPSVHGKERVKIRSRRFRALKRLEAFESQMHRAKRALAETESQPLLAATGPVPYAAACVAYPAPVMYNAEWPAGSAWNATPDFWSHPAALFQPFQWDQPVTELNRELDISPLQESQPPIERPSVVDRGSQAPGDDVSVHEEVPQDKKDVIRCRKSCGCRCHSLPRTVSASW